MSVPAIQTALQQMQALKAETAAPSASSMAANAIGAANSAVPQGGFATELKQSLERINSLQQTAAANTKAFQLGDPNVSLNQVMVDKQKAGLAFEMGVQVRNKLVSAYKEIMNMQV
ncbi:MULTISPECIES: flagellar hook-basal body complex protein FliE [Idiomarinaceae]|uniref:Flagellar hook-basal body complex protein FliE n=5 Tax=Pseudidiomarina TaxID=2800384 RepID=A0A368UYQ3_9GAMM|nr:MULTISPECIES: flagellar hook-basal body complex protein FliE [Idiomarinaceae]MDT7526580.1 flagellar hook-basal body complex protein FliE [Pseudidiomarina sp. GXY010]MDX1526772.1 flagellar hook-basal body complex protein FliE [Pseudidiomarina maritima]MRJ42107.1 flagellar hook-basal body complex protein FliE [Idiomarina sp. FeN1]NCU57032.1 flagellar hook-basal body complex protein FliE [Idiomarina sp. FenA--70]NCU59741.1 flagellar hook-basal body complex protein FliE [Idiomarina sp. FenBw--7